MENSIKSFHFVFRNPSLRWSDFKYSIQLHWIHSYFNVIGKLMINNSKRRFRAKTLNLNFSWQLPIYDVLSQIWIKPHPPRGAQPRLSSPTMVEGAPPSQSKVTGYERQQILSRPDKHGICHKLHLCKIFLGLSKIVMN